MRPGRGKLEELYFPGNLVTELKRMRRQQGRQGRQLLTTRAATEGYQARFGMFLDGWYQETVAANQTAQILNRFGSIAALRKVAFGRDGYVVWLQARLDAALTGGTCTVEVYVNGAASGLAATLDGDNPSFAEESGETEFAFAAEDVMDLRVTTSGFGPTSANLLARVGLVLV